MECGRQRIEDITSENEVVEGVYALRSKDVPMEYRHGYFFRMKVADASGEILVTTGGRDEGAVRMSTICMKVNSLVRLVGTTSSWNGRLSVVSTPQVTSLEPAADDEFDRGIPALHVQGY